MKATILLATLKKGEFSNTEVLSEFFSQKLKKNNIDSEIIRLVNYNIPPGTYHNMGDGDDWPTILEKLKASEIIIFATPIWWGNHSSEMQKVIERLDEVHDEIRSGKKSILAGKAGGIIITGDSDGTQHIIGNIANFYNIIGLNIPPMTTLTVVIDEHEKGHKNTKEELMAIYEKDYAETAETMAKNLADFFAK